MIPFTSDPRVNAALTQYRGQNVMALAKLEPDVTDSADSDIITPPAAGSIVLLTLLVTTTLTGGVIQFGWFPPGIPRINSFIPLCLPNDPASGPSTLLQFQVPVAALQGPAGQGLFASYTRLQGGSLPAAAMMSFTGSYIINPAGSGGF